MACPLLCGRSGPPKGTTALRCLHLLALPPCRLQKRRLVVLAPAGICTLAGRTSELLLVCDNGHIHPSINSLPVTTPEPPRNSTSAAITGRQLRLALARQDPPLDFIERACGLRPFLFAVRPAQAPSSQHGRLRYDYHVILDQQSNVTLWRNRGGPATGVAATS